MSFPYTNSNILDTKPGVLPIVVDENLVAIPMSGSTTKLMVIHNGQPIKVCRNRQSAMNLITKLSKKRWWQSYSPPIDPYSVTTILLWPDLNHFWASLIILRTSNLEFKFTTMKWRNWERMLLSCGTQSPIKYIILLSIDDTMGGSIPSLFL